MRRVLPTLIAHVQTLEQTLNNKPLTQHSKTPKEGLKEPATEHLTRSDLIALERARGVSALGATLLLASPARRPLS